VGVEAGAVGTVVVVVAGAVEVGAEPGTTMIAGRVVVDWAIVVDEAGGLVVALVAGLVGDGTAVVGSGRVVRAGDGAAVVATVVGAGSVVRSDAPGRVSVVVGAAAVSVVVGPAATVGPVVIGCSGRGADGLELPELHADSAAAQNTTTVSQRVHALRDGTSSSRPGVGLDILTRAPFAAAGCTRCALVATNDRRLRHPCWVTLGESRARTAPSAPFDRRTDTGNVSRSRYGPSRDARCG
jgi:hypothetical protein